MMVFFSALEILCARVYLVLSWACHQCSGVPVIQQYNSICCFCSELTVLNFRHFFRTILKIKENENFFEDAVGKKNLISMKDSV
jgi:hypothetical protein